MSDRVGYQLVFHPEVANDLRQLDGATRKRVLKRCQWLAEHVVEIAHEPLRGQWAGTYKLRVGDYRAVYTLDHDLERVVIHAVGHRREIYRGPGLA
jgi:mRNA interferase RelE/StbE